MVSIFAIAAVIPETDPLLASQEVPPIPGTLFAEEEELLVPVSQGQGRFTIVIVEREFRNIHPVFSLQTKTGYLQNTTMVGNFRLKKKKDKFIQ